MEKLTILAVDDLAENLMMLRMTLRKLNYNLLFASSGNEALEMLKTQAPDLILMDIQMPGLNGFETTVEIKKMPRFKDTPVLFLSALKDVQNIVNCYEAGGVDYISKPFRAPELIARIETHLKISILQKQLEKEHEKMSIILGNVLPESYVRQLRSGIRPQTESFDEIVVLFTDFKNFTGISRDLGPTESIQHLNHIFFAFDEIVSAFQLERVKTLGDGYFAIAGINTPLEGAKLRVVAALLKMQEFMKYYNSKVTNSSWDLRVGAHSGPAIAGIVGYQKIAFDVWGNVVNIASRLQSVADTAGVLISEEMYAEVKPYVNCSRTETKSLHRLGEVPVYYIDSLTPEGVKNLGGIGLEDVEKIHDEYNETQGFIAKLFGNNSTE